MNKYQHDIDRIMSLIYKEKINDKKNIIQEDVKRVTARIGDLYSVSSQHSIETKLVFYHSQEVCKIIPNCSNCIINRFCKFFRNEQVKIINDEDLKMVDLFCGSGGFSLGFGLNGFQTVYAIDKEPYCIETYRFNHPEVAEDRIVCKDISNSEDDLAKLVGNAEIDVVIGGPPCQGFSMANRQKMIDDPRNKLYKHFVNFIGSIKPKFFVMENVEGILKIKDEIIEDFEALDLKYRVKPFKVNAMDFGVPQNRKRVFFLGTRTDADIDIIIENIIKKSRMNPKTVLNDALFKMKQLSANTKINSHNENSELSGSKINVSDNIVVNDYIRLINNNKINSIIYNHKARYNNSRDIEIFSRLFQGDRSDDPKIADIMPYGNRNDVFKDKYFRLHSERPCKTITAHMKFDCNMYIHPRENRGLTPREAARIQSYPDDYYFTGPYTTTYLQIGNSVPPLIAKAIASAIREELENRR